MQAAFVLHRYRQGETSVLLKAFVRDVGVIPLIARGARRPKSTWRALCQPFVPLMLVFAGRGAVKTVKQLESAAPGFVFNQKALACALYANELLLTLLPEREAQPTLFDAYVDCLSLLMKGELSLALRQFEHELLKHLGISPPLSKDEYSKPLVENINYCLHPGQLPVQSQQQDQFSYPGHILKCIDRGDFSCKNVRQFAKRLHQQWLDFYSNNRVIKSRELLRGCYE